MLDDEKRKIYIEGMILIEAYRIVTTTKQKTLKHSCVLDNGLTDMKVIDRIMNGTERVGPIFIHVSVCGKASMDEK